LHSVTRPSNAALLNVIGLVLATGGMLLQIASGSELYPSLTGPIVLLATAVFVALRPVGWTPFVGVIVPLVLGVGAIVAAAMTGEFVGQATNTGNVAILVGSLMHVLGLAAAVAGGVGMLREGRRPVSVER
jgi:hypothetical protein